MKRTIVLLTAFVAATLALGAMEPIFDDLSEAQRYDLAHAYSLVADRFDELNETERAAGFRGMVEVIYPGYVKSARPAEIAKPVQPQRPQTQAPDPAGGDASYYYFNKMLRGIFNENVSLSVSVISDVLFLPLYDAGIEKRTVAENLEWFFSEYDITGMTPDDIFMMSSISVTPLDNGYWRLDVQTWPEYKLAVPEVTFWAEKMGFYFRKFPEGWRLAAIGPVA